MSGERCLLDTNAVVGLLRGHPPLQQRLQQADWVGISILTQIEFLAFPSLGAKDRALFLQFADSIDVVGLDRSEPALINEVARLRWIDATEWRDEPAATAPWRRKAASTARGGVNPQRPGGNAIPGFPLSA